MVPIELGLKEMAAGSRAVLRLSDEWASGSLTTSGNPVLKGAGIWVELVLHSVENEPSAVELGECPAVVAFALEKKRQGNDCLAVGQAADCNRAVKRYEAGIRALLAIIPPEVEPPKRAKPPPPPPQPPLAPADDTQRGEVLETLVALRLNAAQAHIKRKSWKEVVEVCDAVLRRSEGNAKARYRRALARIELGELEDASADLRALATADPSDSAVRRELTRVERLRKEHRDCEKAVFKGAFEKAEKKEQERERRLEAMQKAEEEKKKAEEELRRKEMQERRRKAEERRKAEAEAAGEDPDAEPAMKKGFLNEPDAPPIYPLGSKEGAAGEAAVKSDNALKAQIPGLAEGKSLLDSLPTVEEPPQEPPQLPPNLKSKPAEKPPPISYSVPSFLQAKNKTQAKRSGA